MSRRTSAPPDWRGAEIIGIVLIALGAIFILRNAGIVDIGLGTVGAIVFIGIGLLLLVGALLPRSGSAASAAIPRDGTTRLDLDLTVGAGTFRIGGGAAGLLEIDSADDDIVTSVDRAPDRTRVRVRQRTDWFPFGWRGPYSWDVRLAEDVETALALSAGAGDFAVDLTRLRIVDARISAGAAKVHVALPRPSGEVRLNVSAGAASVTIQVPPGVEARFATSGLMSVEGRNETPGYATARDRVLVTVSGGAASLRIV